MTGNENGDKQQEAAPPWRRACVLLLPYPLLLLGTGLALTQASSAQERLTIVGGAAITAAWLLIMHRWVFRSGAIVRLLYVVGTLLFAGLLMTIHPLFFVFTIIGFFQTYVLRPPILGVPVVFVTSVMINVGTIGFPPDTPQAAAIFGAVILIQTTAIGGGVMLEHRVSRQNEERRQAVARLEAALEENAGLHAQLLVQARDAGILDERQRMAREIHDTLAQGLAGIVTQLEAASHAASTDHQRHLDHAVRLARDSLAEARRTVHAVGPEQLETARLTGALREVADQWSELHGLPVEMTVTGPERALDPEIEAALLRTAQEALTNVAKHANASRVGVTSTYMEDVVMLDIRDDGLGFDPGRIAAGDATGRYGLTGMRQRVRRLAGSLEIESAPGSGTAISASLPAIPERQSWTEAAG